MRHTERLTIRPFRPDDWDAASALWPALYDTSLPRDTFTWLTLTQSQLAALHQRPIGDQALVRRDTAELLGVVGLTYAAGPYSLLDHTPAPGAPIPWSLEIGLYWALDPAHRGHGYATEAARSMVALAAESARVHRVIAHTEHTNHASRAVMERLGMHIQTFDDVPDAPWFQTVGQLPTGHPRPPR